MPTPTTQPVSDSVMQTYLHALSTFDWSFEFSEDMDLWRRCKAKEAQLRIMQSAIDPTGEIWMKHKPHDCGPLPTVKKEVPAHG